ncbi:calcineurin subunit B type 2-like [Oppia nitens]|uniref:calcineurin subunit B type 2-like n=1 Tax=Oppia nitens TaxID=1686743 RepID=UPI0023DB8F28|nr:calcineurin subunit B type 2-like [Oppia nitens]
MGNSLSQLFGQTPADSDSAAANDSLNDSINTSETGDQSFRELQEETGFTRRQLEQFYERFKDLVRFRAKGDVEKSTYITVEDLSSLESIRLNPLGDRISRVFISYATTENSMKFPEFVKTLALFRTTSGDKEDDRQKKRIEKLRFLFKIYDTRNDGSITDKELCEILDKVFSDKADKKEMSKQVVQDMNKGIGDSVSFDDFCRYLSSVDIDITFSLPFLKRRSR